MPLLAPVTIATLPARSPLFAADMRTFSQPLRPGRTENPRPFTIFFVGSPPMAATSIRATVFPRPPPAVDVVLAVGGAAVIALAAQVSISLPFTPVPLTLQTFAVAATAAALGLRIGAASSFLYVG